MEKDNLSATKRLMSALARMQPKPHEDMKLGETRAKPAKVPARSAAPLPRQPKTA